MDKLMIVLRRGFTNEDLASVLRKTEERSGLPGAIIPLSPAEFKAWLAWNRQS